MDEVDLQLITDAGSLVLVVTADDTGPTALLTVRGKDHDLTAAQLEELGDACARAAFLIRRREVARANS